MIINTRTLPADHPSLHLVPRRYFSLARQVARKHKKPASQSRPKLLGPWSFYGHFIVMLCHLHPLSYFDLPTRDKESSHLLAVSTNLQDLSDRDRQCQ